MDERSIREECAVFGIVAAGPWPNQNVGVPEIIFNGLVGLQHRGQESSGIVVGSGSEDLCEHEQQLDDNSANGMRRKHCKNTTCEKDRLRLKSTKGMGLVSSIFKAEDMLYLKGNLGIGHNRYSTAGGSDIINCQPIVLKTQFGELALAHNGQIVNVHELQQQLYRQGGTFTADSDTEMISRALIQLGENVGGCNKCMKKGLSSPKKANDQTIQNNQESHNGHGPYSKHSHEEDSLDPKWPQRLLYFMANFPLAYSLLLLHRDAIYAARDAYGNRPLILGKLSSTVDSKLTFGWIVASESCCFKNINCTRIREVLPGEIVKITQTGIETVGRSRPPQPQISRPFATAKTATCVFEYVYFARGNSYFEGQQVYGVRKRCGIELAKEAKDKDLTTFDLCNSIVSNVPDSSTAAALGYAKESGIPYAEVLLKNAFIGRSFIQPNQELRVNAIAQKFGPLCENIQGKTIFLIDDSVVRGNTLRAMVKLLKDAGAVEVHVRAACPPVKFPCYMGVNIPTKAELIANQFSDVGILAKYLGAASICYLSIEGLLKAINEKATAEFRGQEAEWQKVERGHCTACLTGDYPVDLDW